MRPRKRRIWKKGLREPNKISYSQLHKIVAKFKKPHYSIIWLEIFRGGICMPDNTTNQEQERELAPFQLRNIGILTHLLQYDAVTDDIVDLLHQSELDYFTVIEKYNLLDKKVNVDEKTNLLKYKDDYLTNIIKTASRIYYGVQNKKYTVSFIRFDIDNFSNFNNRYGHDIGDIILKKFAEVIKEHSRPTDYVIRFGGEEFDVILPSTDLIGAEVYAAKILYNVRKIRVEYGSQELTLTVSAGISSMEYIFDSGHMVLDEKVENLFKRLQKEADDALYESKSTGKDRYSTYQPGMAEEYLNYRKNYKKN